MQTRKNFYNPEETCSALFDLTKKGLSRKDFRERADFYVERGILRESTVKAIEKRKKFAADMRARERERALALLSVL